MGVYTPQSLNIKPPSGGFREGGWYRGRQYIGGTLSDPGVIHSGSSQQGAGQAVSAEVNRQSAQAQGVSAPQFEGYLQQQRQLPAPVQQQLPAPVQQQQLPQAPTGQQGAGAGAGVGTLAPQPTINLPELYKSLTQSSGITQSQQRITDSERQYLEARNKISDNPFLDASTMDKRMQRLQQKFEQEVQPIRNEIAMKQADVEMQLNLQTKQFDINNEQAKQALSQFDTLVGLGSLDNANGDDIAAIVRTTGLSSSMIQGAIDAKKAKNVDTQTIQWDDGTDMGFAIINSKTGDIISKQTIGASTPTAAEQKAGISGSSGSTTQTGAVAKENQTSDVQYLITLYQNTNKNNSSWQKAHDLRQEYSPTDFYNMLLVNYPSASTYIKSIKSLFVK